MISANELRLGNLVQKDCGAMGLKMLSVTPSMLMHLSGNSALYQETIKPIPLTPEILEKCGFEKWDERGKTFERQFDNGNQFQIDLNDFEVFLGGSDSCTGGMGFTTECNYIHQLQNLYFALTGTELEIKNLVEV